MYVKQPKKLLILNILDILRKYSDEDHRLSQREIGRDFENRVRHGRRPESHSPEPFPICWSAAIPSSTARPSAWCR